MKREEISLERQLVLMTAVEMDDSQGEALEKILIQNLNWSEIIFQMISHRTLNMFHYNLKKFGQIKRCEQEIQRLLTMQWQAFGERNRFYMERLTEILKEFDRAGLVVPILKGNLLTSIVYPEIEARVFNDLDFLMKLDDVNKVTEVLTGLGYIQGEYNKENHSIIKASRKEILLQQMSTHEIQEFIKLSDNKFASFIEVDVNHDILWKGNCPYRIDTRELIARAVPIEINNTKGYMLSYIDNIIQLCCHLYKEAALMIWIVSLKDLKIYKFADLFSYIKKFYQHIDWNQLIERVREYSIEKIVYYNFHYIEMMFGQIVPKEVMDAIRPESITYLDEYAIENEKPSVWNFHFFERLFDANRILSIDKSVAAKMDTFMEAKLKTREAQKITG